MPRKAGVRVSCKRCQFRKLRCSRTDPCQSCTEANQPCEYRDQDRKRRPVSLEYVTALEARIAWLESLLISVKTAAPDDRSSMLDAVSFGDDLPSLTDNPCVLQVASALSGATHVDRRQRQQHQVRLEAGPEGSLIYHGPTSIYRVETDKRAIPPGNHQPAKSGKDGDIMAIPSSPIYSGSDTNFDHVAKHFGINMEDELITNALLQFFKWQYPHFMFIYREAFLREHFGDRSGCRYWSTALVLSLCALGSLMSSDPQERLMSDQFFAAAESIIIVSGLTQPSITTVQTFLSLAFYEIGRGNFSKAWGFSGIAFRMAQDLGFQKDPKHWVDHDSSIVTPEDIEVRRRIYWGCYTSDKTISIILGRPVQLYHDDAEVELMEKLPDFPEMEAWLSAGIQLSVDDQGLAVDGASAQPLVLCFKEQIVLSKIIERMLSTLFSTRSNLDSLGRRVCIDTLNLDMCRWQESLPDSIKWNKWEPPNSPLLPSVAALHMLFRSARIALHFDQANSDEGDDRARLVCICSAQDVVSIVRRYRSRFGLSHAPLIFIYGIVQAIRALRTFESMSESQYLIQALDECCVTWGLAGQARKHMYQRMVA